MDIGAIGARLFDAMGVGVALIDAERLTLRYSKPTSAHGSAILRLVPPLSP
ncbi:MAG: hypothetical protein NXH97_05500 [Rhodobacteraceae bacterium]|nr:hypothetical protein [Paracoccaceae bacterium]